VATAESIRRIMIPFHLHIPEVSDVFAKSAYTPSSLSASYAREPVGTSSLWGDNLPTPSEQAGDIEFPWNFSPDDSLEGTISTFTVYLLIYIYVFYLDIIYYSCGVEFQ
jgi:hypothetical protein